MSQDRIVSKETLGHRRVVRGLSPENARPLSKAIPKQRDRQRFVEDPGKIYGKVYGWDTPQPETPSKKGRNSRRRAYKRDKKRIEDFKQRALR